MVLVSCIVILFFLKFRDNSEFYLSGGGFSNKDRALGRKSCSWVLFGKGGFFAFIAREISFRLAWILNFESTCKLKIVCLCAKK